MFCKLYRVSTKAQSHGEMFQPIIKSREGGAFLRKGKDRMRIGISIDYL